MRVSFASALLAGVVLWAAPASADSETQLRLNQLEEQMRQMTGQLEELSYELKQTREQLAAIQGAGIRKKAAEAEDAPTPAKRKIVAASQGQGIEQIAGEPQISASDDDELVTTITNDDGSASQVAMRKAPGPKVLGTLPGTSDDFQGQVLVDANGQDVSEPASVETVALGTSATEAPEAVYERSYESLLRRQFGEAEGGFRLFLDQHRDHSLAGNAQYWLGETYYVQGDYKQAAQSFLTGFKDFPKSRKAPDSLLKLGLSLNRLGQKDQACAAFAAVGERFPKAAEAKKRSMVEQKRAGC